MLNFNFKKNKAPMSRWGVRNSSQLYSYFNAQKESVPNTVKHPMKAHPTWENSILYLVMYIHQLIYTINMQC